MKTTNKGVIEAYLKGQTGVESHTGNLWISADGKRLMNYATCLVERNADYGMIINSTRYSNSTSKIQSSISGTLCQIFGGEWISENTIVVENVPFNTSYLDRYAQEKIEWSKGIKPVKLINYFDVWGNKKDGWEINNMCEEHAGELELHQDVTNEEIVKYLKNIDFLKKTVRMNQLLIEDLGEFGVEIYQKKDSIPLCRIEFEGGRY